MNNWRSLPSQGGVIGLVLTVLSVVVWGIVTAITLLNALASDSAGANPGTFLLGLLAVALLVLTIFLGWRTWCFFKLGYRLDRNTITVNLGDSCQIIPLANIQEVVTAENLLKVLREAVQTGKMSENPLAVPNETPNTFNRVTPSTPSKITDDPFFAEGPLPTRSNTITKNAPKSTEAADSSFDEPFEIVQVVPTETEMDETSDQPVEVVMQEAEPALIEIPTSEDSLETKPETEPTPEVESVQGEVVAPDEPEAPLNATDSELEAATAEVRAEDKSESENIAAHTSNLALAVKMGGLRWPGYYFNLGYFPPMGQLQFYATAPFARTVLIRTYNITYALTPTEPQRFLTELKLRRNLGATEELAEIRRPNALLAHPLWQDWTGRALIILGVLGNMALFLYLLLNFQNLPQNVQIHFNKFGEPDRIGVVGDLMWLPFIGLVALTVNSVLGAWVQVRDKVPAYLLYLASIIIQLLIALALVGILGGSNTGS